MTTTNRPTSNRTALPVRANAARVRVLLLTVSSAASAVLFVRSGQGPLTELRRAADLAASDPVGAAAAAAHVVALVAFTYLATIGLLNLVGSVVPGRGGDPRPVGPVLARLTPRVMSVGLAGLVVVSTSVTPVAAEDRTQVASDGASTVASPPVMHLVEPAPAPASPTPTAPRLEPVPTTTAPVTEPGSAASSPTVPSAPMPSESSVPTQDPAPARATHVVRAGEHFWSIAETVVAARPDTQLDVPAYWRLLVEANRERLIDQDNPDLLHPGQELVLP